MTLAHLTQLGLDFRGSKEREKKKRIESTGEPNQIAHPTMGNLPLTLWKIAKQPLLIEEPKLKSPTT